MIRRLLVANRGEIARRVFATCARMGIQTVAVYSDADRDAQHVQACDEAVHIGGPAPRDSYLQWQRILEAASELLSISMPRTSAFETTTWRVASRVAGLK